MRSELDNEFKGSLFSLSKMHGEECILEWKGGVVGCKVMLNSTSKMTVKLSVNNAMVDRKILNIFGAIKGFEEPGNNNCLVAQS